MQGEACCPGRVGRCVWDENMSTDLFRTSSRLPAKEWGGRAARKLREVEAGQVLGTPRTAPASQGLQVLPTQEGSGQGQAQDSVP